MHSSRMRTARLLTVSQHALLGGVPAGDVPARGLVYLWGVYLLRGCTWGIMYLPGGVPAQGCTCLGGVPARGLYLLEGVYLPGVVPAGEGVPARGGTCPGTLPCEQNDRQVQKYYLPPKLRLRVVKMISSN